MANRIILSAVITLALTFSPSLAFSVPTKDVKKKSSSSKTQSKVSKKSKSGNKAGKSRSRSQEDTAEHGAVRHGAELQR